MPELWTEDPRLAEVYDVECAGRRDRAFYLALAAELASESLVDIGCGTGMFAVDAARDGRTVIGVDPAEAMLDVARRRPGGAAVEWLHGHADAVPDGIADLAIMMGHVAQYFVSEDDWAEVLDEVRRILAPGGRLAFETRNPAVDWARRWTPARTRARHPHPGGGEFTSWVEVIDVRGGADSYTTTHLGHTLLPDGLHLVASETLRFRSTAEVIRSVDAAGFEVESTWGSWDRTPFGADHDEFIVLARQR